jgi:hypothetical protein
MHGFQLKRTNNPSIWLFFTRIYPRTDGSVHYFIFQKNILLYCSENELVDFSSAFFFWSSSASYLQFSFESCLQTAVCVR